MISIKEGRMMKKMGWYIKSVFVKPNGVQFPKYFSSKDEQIAFIKAAEGYGNKLVKSEVSVW